MGLVKGAEKTAKRQLRAYVCLASLEIIPPDNQVPGVRLSVKIRNTGKTPAFDVTVVTHRTHDEPRSESAVLTSVEFTINSQMIHPRMAYTHNTVVDEFAEHERRAAAPFYFYGYIDYRDIFDDCWRYWFCWEYHWVDFLPYENGNYETHRGKYRPPEIVATPFWGKP